MSEGDFGDEWSALTTFARNCAAAAFAESKYAVTPTPLKALLAIAKVNRATKSLWVFEPTLERHPLQRRELAAAAGFWFLQATGTTGWR